MLPDVAKNIGAVVLDLEMARHVVSITFFLTLYPPILEDGSDCILVKAVIVHLDLGESFEIVRHQ